MLDMSNVHTIGAEAARNVFDGSDPTQGFLRTILKSLSEDELADLERDLQMLSLTGVMSRQIERTLCETELCLELVA